jgi:hypothetical protein
MSEVFDIMLGDIGDNIYKTEISDNIKKWRELISRTHYSHAKANNYCHLYDVIKEKYKTIKLRLSKYSDGSAYANNRILPENLDCIEERLIDIAKRGGHIYPSKLSGYVKLSVESIEKIGTKITFDQNGIRIPKQKFKLIDRIILNRCVYAVGLLLFKKGSGIRAFLKKHL